MDQDDMPVLPTPEQLRRHRYEPWRPDKGDKDSALQDARGTLRRRDGTVLDTLLLRKLISQREWTAGNKLRNDFYLAGLEPRVTAAYEQTIRSTADSAATRKLAAEVRWREAVKGVGKVLSGILVQVVIEDVSPADWAADAYGYAGRSASPAGMAVLRVALQMLGDHYGLER